MRTFGHHVHALGLAMGFNRGSMIPSVRTLCKATFVSKLLAVTQALSGGWGEAVRC